MRRRAGRVCRRCRRRCNVRQPPFPALVRSLEQGLQCRMQSLQRCAQLAAKGDPRRIGHRPSLQLDRPPRSLVGARQDVLHRRDLRLLGQGRDVGIEHSQLKGESAVGICERLAGLVQHRRQGLDLSNQRRGLTQGLDDQGLARRGRIRHAVGSVASPG